MVQPFHDNCHSRFTIFAFWFPLLTERCKHTDQYGTLDLVTTSEARFNSSPFDNMTAISQTTF